MPYKYSDFEEYTVFVQNINRYGWKDIETSCGRLFSMDDLLTTTLDEVSNLISQMESRLLAAVPFDFRTHLRVTNTDLVLIRFIQRRGWDSRLQSILRDPWYKFGYALVRWQINLLSQADFGRVPAQVLTCELLCVAAIWARYERDSEEGDDYNLQERLKTLAFPRQLINRIVFAPESNPRHAKAPYIAPHHMTFGCRGTDKFKIFEC